MKQNDIIKLNFQNKQIRLIETKEEKNDNQIVNSNSKKIKKKQEETFDELEDYKNILKSTYLYNKKFNLLKELNKTKLENYDYNENEINFEISPNNLLNCQVPIIVKNDKFIEYNLNDAIDVNKSSIENFIKNNLNVDNWKFDKNQKGNFLGPSLVNRRRRRGTLKMQRILEEKAKLLNK